MVTDTRTLLGSDLEIIVYRWLVKHKIDFQFQTSFMGGFFNLGGSVVDFIIKDGNIALRVMGEYFHQTVEAQGRDQLQRELLSALGFLVVDVWGLDLENRLDETMYKAINGEEMPR